MPHSLGVFGSISDSFPKTGEPSVCLQYIVLQALFSRSRLFLLNIKVLHFLLLLHRRFAVTSASGAPSPSSARRFCASGNVRAAETRPFLLLCCWSGGFLQLQCSLKIIQLSRRRDGLRKKQRSLWRIFTVFTQVTLTLRRSWIYVLNRDFNGMIKFKQNTLYKHGIQND